MNEATVIVLRGAISITSGTTSLASHSPAFGPLIAGPFLTAVTTKKNTLRAL